MIIAITAIAAAWFGVLSAYFFAAKYLPSYRPGFAKKLFCKPLGIMSISIAFLGFYVAWVSDPVTLRAFEIMGIMNNGIADPLVQYTSLLLTILIGVPIAITYTWLKDTASLIDADSNNEKYFPWAGFLMIVIAALLATSSALLAIPNK